MLTEYSKTMTIIITKILISLLLPAVRSQIELLNQLVNVNPVGNEEFPTIFEPSVYILGHKQITKVMYPVKEKRPDRLHVDILNEHVSIWNLEVLPKTHKDYTSFTFETFIPVDKDLKNKHLDVTYQFVDKEGEIIDHMTSSVSVVKIRPTILIEIDKPIYRPKEVMKIFPIYLNPKVNSGIDMETASSTSRFSLTLNNPANDQMRIWRNLTGNKLEILEYQLFDDLIEGQWTLKAESDERVLSTRHFFVEYYILPRFLASIEMIKVPKYKTDTEMILRFCGKRTNGGYIRGIVNGTVSVNEQTFSLLLNLTYNCALFKIDSLIYGPNRSSDNLHVFTAFEEYGSKVILFSELHHSYKVMTGEVLPTTKLVEKLYFTGLPTVLRINPSSHKNKRFTISCQTDSLDTYIGSFRSKSILAVLLPPLNENAVLWTAHDNKNETIYQGKKDEEFTVLNLDTVATKNFCLPIINLKIIIKNLSDDFELTVLSKDVSIDLPETVLNRNDFEICFDRNDELGHFTCLPNNTIKCLPTFNGPNCMFKMVGFALYNVKEKLNFSVNSNRPTSGVARSFYVYDLEVALNKFIGTKIDLEFLMFNRRTLKFQRKSYTMENLENCHSNFFVEPKWSSFQFDKEISKPGDNVTLSLKINSAKEKHPVCLLKGFDVALKAFDKDGSYVLTLENYLKNLNENIFSNYKYHYNQKSLNQEEKSMSRFSGPQMIFDFSTKIFPVEISSETRKFFPQSWLFQLEKMKVLDQKNANEYDIVLNLLAPDTITRFNVSAICMSENDNNINGIYIPNRLASIVLEKIFHIDIHPPKYLKQLESITIPITINIEDIKMLNNMNYIKIKVVVEPDEWDYEGPSEFLFCSNRITEIIFQTRLRAKKTGELLIKVQGMLINNSIDCGNTKAKNKEVAYSDIVQRKVNVHPSGEVVEKNYNIYLCQDEMREIILPPIIKDSLRVYVTMSSQHFGLSLEYLKDIVKRPQGNGETSLASISTCLSVMDYLSREINTLDDKDYDTLDLARHYIKTGFDLQLNYLHKDGSFSLFGRRDKVGSTWLTSHVFEVFSGATSYVSPDYQYGKILSGCLDFLVQNFDSKLCIIENETSQNYNYMMVDLGDAKNATLIELYKQAGLVMKVIKSLLKALTREYLSDHFGDTSEINSYLGQLSKCFMRNFNMKIQKEFDENLMPTQFLSSYLYTLALFNETEGHRDRKFHSYLKLLKSRIDQIDQDKTDPFRVEILSNYLLIKHHLKDIPENVIEEIKLLLNEQQSNGGFIPPASTPVALEALSKFPTQKILHDKSAEIFLYPQETRKKITIAPNSVMKFKLFEGGERSDSVTSLRWVYDDSIENSCLYTRTSVVYNFDMSRFSEDRKNYFIITDSIEQDVDVCKNFKYNLCISQNDTVSYVSGLIKTTIGIPSGYEVNIPLLREQINESNNLAIKKHEIDQSQNLIIIYFDGFIRYRAQTDSINRCLNITFELIAYVENLQKTIIKVEDFYNPTYNTMKEFSPTPCKPTSDVQAITSPNEYLGHIFNDANLKCKLYGIHQFEKRIFPEIDKAFCNKEMSLAVLFAWRIGISMSFIQKMAGIQKFILQNSVVLKNCINKRQSSQGFQVIFILGNSSQHVYSILEKNSHAILDQAQTIFEKKSSCYQLKSLGKKMFTD